MLLDIRPDHLRMVLDILQKHVPQYEVWAFGSRAKWTAKDYSDLDLCVVSNQPLNFPLLGALAEDFSDSDLPWKVDVVDWATVSESFRKIIARDKVVVQKAGMSEWSTARVAQVATINSEAIGRDWPYSHVSYIDISSVGEGQMEAPPQRLNIADAPSRAKRLVRKGDTVISTVRPNRRSMFFVSNPSDDWVVSTGFAVLRPNTTKIDPRYLYTCIFNQTFTEYLIGREKGAAYPAVSPEDIGNAEIALPPLEKQRAIAHILGTLDDKIELNRRMNETLEAIARAIFKSWFVDFDPVRAKASGEAPESICQRLGLTPDLLALFPDRLVDSELGDGSTSLTTGIPEGWGIGAFHSCCERIESGGTPSRSIAEYWNGSIPWLTSGEVRDVIVLDTKEKITEAGLNASSAKIWPIGTTVVAMYGATAGQVCLLAEAMTANQACCALIPKPEFISFVFLTARASISQLSDKASGSAQQNLNKSLVANHQLILPTLKIAEAFERIVSCLIDKWISNQRGSESLAALRDALLPKLLSGELRVPDAEKALEA